MRKRRFTILAFGALLFMATFRLTAEPPPPPERSSSPAPRSSSTVPPVGSGRDIPEFARLLFRAPQMKGEEVETPVPPPSNLRLLGAIISAENRVAVVEQDGAVFRLREGDVQDGWLVSSIGARSLRLTQTDQIMDIPLDPPSSP